MTAKEIHPFTLFRLPGLGQEYVKDFRPMPVPVEVAPPSVPVVEEAPNPKSHSSATGNVAPLEGDSSQTTTTEPTSLYPASTESSAGAEKVSPSRAADSLIHPTLQLPGAGQLPVAHTGPTVTTAPPLTVTPSSPGEDSGSQAP